MDMHYARDIPKALLHEAELLRQVGRLATLLEEEAVASVVCGTYPKEGFRVGRDAGSGAITITNYRLRIGDDYADDCLLWLGRPDSNQSGGLYVQGDTEDVYVFKGGAEELCPSFLAHCSRVSERT